MVMESPSCTSADGAADGGFRSNVADDQSVRGAGETAVGDQSDGFAQAGADEGGGGRKHFAHAGAALAGLRSESRSRRRDGFGSRGWRPGRSSSESKTRAGPVIFIRLGNFGDGAFGGQVALQDDQVAVRSDGRTPRMNHVLILARLGGNVRQRFGDGLAGDGQSVAVQHAVRQQNLHDLRNAAGGVQFRDDVFAGGLQIAEHRNARADGLEIVE